MVRRVLRSLAVLFVYALATPAWSAPVAQFNYAGQLTNAAGTAPLEQVVALRFSIYAPRLDGDPAKDCLLYEELHAQVDLTRTEGRFEVTLGTLPGSPLRTERDPGLESADVLNNGRQLIGRGDRGRLHCARDSGYVPAADDTRELVIAVVGKLGARTVLRDTLILPPPGQSAPIRALRSQTVSAASDQRAERVDDVDPERTRFEAVPALGIMSLSYQETGKQSFSGLALTPSLKLSLPIHDRLAASANVAYGMFELKSNLTGQSLRYLDADLGLTMRSAPDRSPWSFNFGGGMFYSAAIPNPESMGFNGLLGPQIHVSASHPVLTRFLITAQGRFAMIGEGFRLVGFSAHDLGGALIFSRPALAGRDGGITVKLDVARLQTQLDGLDISAMRTSLSFGYGL